MSRSSNVTHQDILDETFAHKIDCRWELSSKIDFIDFIIANNKNINIDKLKQKIDNTPLENTDASKIESVTHTKIHQCKSNNINAVTSTNRKKTPVLLINDLKQNKTTVTTNHDQTILQNYKNQKGKKTNNPVDSECSVKTTTISQNKNQTDKPNIKPIKNRKCSHQGKMSTKHCSKAIKNDQINKPVLINKSCFAGQIRDDCRSSVTNCECGVKCSRSGANAGALTCSKQQLPDPSIPVHPFILKPNKLVKLEKSNFTQVQIKHLKTYQRRREESSDTLSPALPTKTPTTSKLGGTVPTRTPTTSKLSGPVSDRTPTTSKLTAAVPTRIPTTSKTNNVFNQQVQLKNMKNRPNSKKQELSSKKHQTNISQTNSKALNSKQLKAQSKLLKVKLGKLNKKGSLSEESMKSSKYGFRKLSSRLSFQKKREKGARIQVNRAMDGKSEDTHSRNTRVRTPTLKAELKIRK